MNTLTPRELFQALTSEEQMEACKRFWTHSAFDQQHILLLNSPSFTDKFRKASIQRWDANRKAQHLLKRILIPDLSGMIGTVVDALFVTGYFCFHIDEFLEASGPSATGNATHSKLQSFSVEVLIKGIQLLLERYGARPVYLLLSAMRVSEDPTFINLELALTNLNIDLRKCLNMSLPDNHETVAATTLITASPSPSTAETPIPAQSEDQSAAIKALHEKITLLSGELKEAEDAKTAAEDRLKSDDLAHKKALEEQKKTWKEKLYQEKDKLKRVSELEDKLRICVAERETIIEKRVQEELSAAVRPWLSQARMLEKLSATRTDITLQNQFGELIAKQTNFDMKTGSKQRLKNRLCLLEGYASKAKEILRDSIQPLPDWPAFLETVEKEIANLRRVLGEDPQDTGLTAQLKDLVVKTPDTKQLKEIELLVGTLSDNNLLSGRQQNALYKAIHKAFDKISMLSSDTSSEHFIPSGWNLRRVLATNQNGIVYVDGDNVVLSLRDCYARFYEDGRAKDNARSKLVEHVKTLATQCSNVHFHIVFDDYKESRNQMLLNITVEQSGGQGFDKADSAIVLHLAKLQSTEETFVVTEDRSFRAQANKLGAIYVPVGIWQELLEDLDVLPKYEAEQPVAAVSDAKETSI